MAPPRKTPASIPPKATSAAPIARGARARARPRVGAEAGDEIGAAELARRVAESLKRYRQERKLSLDDLSARSGVSRAALSQIEGARTNPTLAVLWKIAVGLEIPFHDLMGTSSRSQVLVLRAGDSPPLRSADGRTQSRLLSPGGSDTTTEIFELRLAPKARLESEPHAAGTAETLVVLTGALRLDVDGTVYQLNTGDSVYFRADTRHVYENQSSREARCIDVIYYAR